MVSTTRSSLPTHPVPEIGAQATLWGLQSMSTNPLAARWLSIDARSAILHQPNWLNGADGVFDELATSVPWRSMQRPMYDQIVDVPRLIANISRAAPEQGPWPASDGGPKGLWDLVDLAETAIGAEFGRVGLNLYRNGNDSVTWHRDELRGQRAWSVVALVSLGATRTLSMRPAPWHRPDASPHRFRLSSGDLLVMIGRCQRDWEHAILKTKLAGPRISVALRSEQFPHGPLFQQPGVPPWAHIAGVA